MKDEVLFYFDELNIRSILRDLIRNFWMLIMAAFIGAFAVSGYTNIIYQPEYTSKATLVISAKGSGTADAYANLTTTTEMAQVFSNVFSSNVLKKHVQEALNEPGAQFEIKAETIPETNLMILSVTGNHPKIVYQAICEAIDHYADVSDYVFSNAVLDVMESPEVATYASNSIHHRKFQMQAALAATVLMGAFLVFMSVMRSTVKTEASATRRLKGKKLALIGHEAKNRTLKSRIKGRKKSILITNPITTFGYVETFRKLAFRIHNEMKKKNQQILLISSASENEGKSTVASNIALGLAQSGKNVILMDLDLRKPAIYKIFDKTSNVQDGFWEEEIVVTGKNNLTLLLNQKVVKNPAIAMKKMNLETMFAQLKQEADYIIIDSSPMNVAADTELLLNYADTVLMVVRQDWAYTNDVNYYVDVLGKMDTDYMGYVLNDFVNSRLIGSKQYSYGKKYGSRYGYGYGYGNYHK